MRNFLEWFDRHPRFEAMLELLVGVLLTFLPFVAAAGLAQVASPSFSGGEFVQDFISYFDGGELTLVIFGTIGSILWFLFIRAPAASMAIKTGILVLALFAVLLIGGIISDNLGFSADLPDWVLSSVLGAYLVSLVAHVALILRYTGREPSSERGLDRAHQLRQRAKERFDG